MRATERNGKIQRQTGERNEEKEAKKKKWRESGKLSHSISMWTQEHTIKRALPNMEKD